jgi:hypothetical protein
MGISICKSRTRAPVTSGARRLHIGRRHQAVGAGDHDDVVLRVLVDGDHRHAGGDAGRDEDIVRTDALAGQVAAHVAAEDVVADAPHHLHSAAHARGHHRLVGALAAVAGGEAAAVDRFTGPREAFDIGVHVEIDGADDADGWCGHGRPRVWNGYDSIR